MFVHITNSPNMKYTSKIPVVQGGHICHFDAQIKPESGQILFQLLNRPLIKHKHPRLFFICKRKPKNQFLT